MGVQTQACINLYLLFTVTGETSKFWYHWYGRN